jgi:hypothetical protein
LTRGNRSGFLTFVKSSAIKEWSREKMSQDTTDKILAKLEAWYKEQRQEDSDSPRHRFQGFDGLLGANLEGIDLSSKTIQQKAKEFMETHQGEKPPWFFAPPMKGVQPGLYLAGAMLSEDVDGRRIALKGAKLQGAFLWNVQLQGANLHGAKLQEAHLSDAQLQKADLWMAELQGAYLSDAHLQETNLRWAHLQGADLWAAQLEEARLEDVLWDGRNGYVLNEEDTEKAEIVYRHLKQWYSHSGQYDHAGEFHKREMMMRRKNLWQRRSLLECLALWLLGVSSGYGERPSWVLGWTLACWLGFALLYWLGGALQGQVFPAGPFLAALYYSATAITTFGPPILSSKWGVVAATPWALTVAQIQGVLAYFLLALFLVTLVQKASRS